MQARMRRASAYNDQILDRSICDGARPLFVNVMRFIGCRCSFPDREADSTRPEIHLDGNDANEIS
jgi:hypothetical protein